MNILFFGSTSDSVIVAEKLLPFGVAAAVTQPPRPVGRDRTVTPTPVERWAKDHGIAVLSFPSNPDKPWRYADEQQVIDTLEPVGAELVVSASYGQMIPAKTITDARYGGLNVHPSLLPRWRGGDPVPWAIMSGDHQTGVTVVSLSEKFDEGVIYAQKKIPITDRDTSGPLRTRLFAMGADMLTELLPLYTEGKAKGKPQHGTDEPRATRLTRDTGYEPWPFAEEESTRIERKFRALSPWPGLWTKLPVTETNGNTVEKRLKILSLHSVNGALTLDEVQLEGKNPVSWDQFRRVYLPT